jgi:hypothetical protein
MTDGTPRTLAMGVLDRATPINSPILIRGDLKQPGDVTPRGLVEVLCAKGEPLNIGKGSGRLDLAYWIASKDNPLTARVMANRVWLKLMGSAHRGHAGQFRHSWARSPRIPNCSIIWRCPSWRTAGR